MENNDSEKSFDRKEFHNKRMENIIDKLIALDDAIEPVTPSAESIKEFLPSIADAVNFTKRMEAVEEAAKNLKSAVSEHIEWLKKGLLPDMLNNEDITSAKVSTETGKWQVVLYSDMYVAAPAATKHLLKEWLVENEYGDMITETINASSLGAFVKNAFKEGLAYPEELIKITPYQGVQIRKA